MAAFADNTAAPVEGFAASDNIVEERECSMGNRRRVVSELVQQERTILLASSPRAFSRPVPSALAAAHTYRRICQVSNALPQRFLTAVRSLTELDHFVQQNLPPWE